MRLAIRPEFALGGLQENDSLEFDARGLYLSATALADGQIVVADHQRLKFFTVGGKLTRIVGRGGSGPGEFSIARDLCPQTDSSLLVIDDDGRWTQWDRDGNLRHSQARVGFVPDNGCSNRGALLVRESSLDGSFTATTRRTLPYSLYRTDGTEIQPVGRLAAPEYFGPLFFEPSFAILGNELLIAEPQRFELRTQSLATGRTTRRWTVHGASRPLSDAAWDSLIKTGFPSNATATQRSKRLTRLKELGKPAAYPAFWKVRVDPLGRIWINPYFDHLHWYVIDNDGSRVSLVSIPIAEVARPQLVGFAGALVVVRHVDDAGAAALSFFRVLADNP